MAKPILIVDDNPNMASLLSEMLEIFDYDSVRASDGKEALKALSDQKFAMVITDMRMPNMTGLELLEKIKAEYPKLPVVMISGYSVSSIHSDVDGVKPDGFLAKPFLMSDIEQLVNSLL